MTKLQTPDRANTIILMGGLTGFIHLPTHMENGKSKVVPSVEWWSTQTAAVVQPGSHQNVASDLLYKCKALVTNDGDKVSIGSHYSIGNIIEILVPNQKHITSHITISCLEFLLGLHPQLHIPCLKFPTLEHKVVITPESFLLKIVKNISCTVNVQHDCASSGAVCDKEHSEITKKKLMIDHALTNMYLLNVYALHNYWQIATAIPGEIAANICNKAHTSALARSLAPGGSHEVTLAHWGCFAFLCASMMTFEVIDECKEAQAACKKVAPNRRQESTTEAGENAENDDQINLEAATGESAKTPARMWASSDYWEFLVLLLHDI
ncbi:hypothetical protein BS17DRAFT_770269 [Gyrodon lividus]|nr:hypothetical protein BS17DRAFT_770269 [Gyrodon lividus]